MSKVCLDSDVLKKFWPKFETISVNCRKNEVLPILAYQVLLGVQKHFCGSLCGAGETPALCFAHCSPLTCLLLWSLILDSEGVLSIFDLCLSESDLHKLPSSCVWHYIYDCTANLLSWIRILQFQTHTWRSRPASRAQRRQRKTIPNWTYGLNPNTAEVGQIPMTLANPHSRFILSAKSLSRVCWIRLARNGSSTSQAYYSACSIVILRVRRYSSSRWQMLFRQRSSGSCYPQACDRMHWQDILLSTCEWDMRIKTMCPRRISLVSFGTIILHISDCCNMSLSLF